MKSLARFALWRISGPAISFIGQGLIILSNSETAFQKEVFFVLSIQIMLGAFEYPFFLAARKIPMQKVPDAYVIICVIFIFLIYTLDGMQSVNALSYTVSTMFLLVIFADIFVSERSESVFEVTIKGILRNGAITGMLYLYVGQHGFVLGAILISLTLYFLYLYIFRLLEKANANKRKEMNVDLKASEILYGVSAAILSSIFYIMDRVGVIYFDADSVGLVNKVYLASSVILVLSNIWAVASSHRVNLASSQQKIRTSGISVVISVVGAVIFAALQLKEILIVWCLLSVTVSFAQNSPILLAIQEARSAKTTAQAYFFLVTIKALLFWFFGTIYKVSELIALIPLLGTLGPIITILISKSNLKVR